MKAAILVESKKPLKISDIDFPKKLEFGQVLVKISVYFNFLKPCVVSITDEAWPDPTWPGMMTSSSGKHSFTCSTKFNFV